jgi:hypothetical protein
VNRGTVSVESDKGKTRTPEIGETLPERRDGTGAGFFIIDGCGEMRGWDESSGPMESNSGRADQGGRGAGVWPFHVPKEMHKENPRMKRLIGLTLTALIGMAASAMAAHPCCTPQCITPPGPNCPDCSSPCDHCLHLSLGGCEHVQRLIQDLNGCTCCDRICAVKKLGCRAHGDFCNNPEILAALVNALQCDPCWEVRRAAAWSILGQNARTEQGVLALYIASRLDPHCLVRERAAEALDILTLGRKECFAGVFENGDKLIADLKKAGYRPGSANCSAILVSRAEEKTPADKSEVPVAKRPGT